MRTVAIISLLLLVVSSVALAWDTEISGCGVGFDVASTGEDYVVLRISAQKGSLFQNASMTRVAFGLSKNPEVFDTNWTRSPDAYWINSSDLPLNVGYITASTFTTRWTNLSPGTTYYYRMKVEINGAIAESKLGTVRTRGKSSDVAADSLKLNKTKASVDCGKTLALKTTVKPANATYTWSSSDAKIASVDGSGKVTGNAVGKATITVTSSNGKTASCVVTVKEVKAKKITISSFATNPITMYEGEEYLLVGVISPENTTNKSINWSSNKPNIASVDSKTGMVSANSTGSATITAKTANGKKATKTVSVVAPILDKTEWSVDIGKQLRLVTNVGDANKKVIWKSDNTSVATVAGTGTGDFSGRSPDETSNFARKVSYVDVKGKKAGIATVTATTADGELLASCLINVGGWCPVLEVRLDRTTLPLAKDAKNSETLIASVLPTNASNKAVTWSSSNTKVVTVDQNGKVTAKGKGVATITAKSKDSGKESTCEVTVYPIAILQVVGGRINGDESSHGRPYCIDVEAGSNLLAPFDGVVTGIERSNNSVWLSSSEDLYLADGSIGKATILVMHDEDISDLWIGKTFKQDERFYQTGNYGYSNGPHIHIESIKGYVDPPLTYLPSSSDKTRRGNAHPWDVFFLRERTMQRTNEVNESLMNWRYIK